MITERLNVGGKYVRPPLPPYPFPHRWSFISDVQTRCGEQYWLPSTEKLKLEANLNGTLSEEVIEEVGERLEFNIAWADRLAATIERLESGRPRKRRADEHTLATQISSLPALPIPVKKEKTARQLKKLARVRPRKVPILGAQM